MFPLFLRLKSIFLSLGIKDCVLDFTSIELDSLALSLGATVVAAVGLLLLSVLRNLEMCILWAVGGSDELSLVSTTVASVVGGDALQGDVFLNLFFLFRLFSSQFEESSGFGVSSFRSPESLDSTLPPSFSTGSCCCLRRRRLSLRLAGVANTTP